MTIKDMLTYVFAALLAIATFFTGRCINDTQNIPELPKCTIEIEQTPTAEAESDQRADGSWSSKEED
jgi:hypothetical protein